MKELLYFSFADLLVKVDYSKEMNSLQYASHRELSLSERVVVEHYLLSNVALKTEYYHRQPSSLVYQGRDEKLIRELNLFHLRNTLKYLAEREKEIKEQVDDLINSSMSTYYFEQIGDTILELRRRLQQVPQGSPNTITTIKATKAKIDQLIQAYNTYSNKKISLHNVVPLDLKEYFDYN